MNNRNDKELFKLVSTYKPTGDQPEAIAKLVEGIKRGDKEQTLLGVTGSGKTFTMANIISQVQKPTLVLAHNKTLAAQLCSEFREFFPTSAVEYFVSYYDYYQPEAYIATTDTYIEKDSAINDEIDKLRHSATSALSERRDVIIVASVSCIYSLGNPIDYRTMVISLRPGMQKNRDELLKKLVELQYERNDINFIRNKFRVRGDVVEIFPAQSNDTAVRVEFFGDEVDRISEFNPLTGEIKADLKHIAIYPASHYIVPKEKMKEAIQEIEQELEERLAYFRREGKLLEAQRIEQRTRYDIEMLQEIGFCKGIENYSRVMAGREPGSAPFTLLDYFPKDYLLFVALIENLPTIIVEIVKAVPQIIAGIVKAFGSLMYKIVEIGGNIVKGLWSGITQLASWLWDKVSGWISSIWDGICDFFGIHSPSKEMAWVGEMLVKGLAGSIDDNGDEAVKAAEGMAEDINGVMGDLAHDMQTALPTDFNVNGSIRSAVDGVVGKAASAFTIALNITNFNNYSSEDIRQLTNEVMETANQFAQRKGVVFA